MWTTIQISTASVYFAIHRRCLHTVNADYIYWNSQ